jgi:hypothetical protein
MELLISSYKVSLRNTARMLKFCGPNQKFLHKRHEHESISSALLVVANFVPLSTM